MSTTTELSIVNQNIIDVNIQERDARISKALAFATKVPEKIESDEADNFAKELIGKYKALLESLETQRKPITQKFDEIRSFFTTQEKKVASTITEISNKRNDFVTAKAEKIRLANIEAQKKRFKDEELIELKTNIELQLRTWMNSFIEAKKQAVLKALETVTSENKDAKIQGLKNMSCEFDPLKYGMFEPKAISKYGNNVADISNEIVLYFENELLSLYKKEIETFKHECLMQINSLVKMNVEEKKAAIEEKATEIKVETSTANEVIEVEIEQKTDVAKAESAFTSIVGEIDNSLPSNIASIEIEVLNDAGWIAIGTFWLTTLAVNFKGNFATKTFTSMKGDVEKYAKYNGVRIESQNLVYHNKLKARN